MATVNYVNLAGLQKFKELQDKQNLTKFWGRSETVSMAAQVGNISIVNRQTQYNTGDIRVAGTLPSGLYLKCTTAGTSAADAPDFSAAEAGNTITDGTVTWTVLSIEAPQTVDNAKYATTAGSANQLTNAYTINGVPFNGTQNITINAVDSTPRVAVSQIGQPNGVAGLDESGFVPASQLPSYVDDVVSYPTLSAFPQTGEPGKIYLAEDTNQIYRWASTGEGTGQYVNISNGSGTADTAIKLQTPRNFSITGGATAAAVSFDGTQDVALNVTALDATKLVGLVPAASIDIGAVSTSEIEAMFSA